MNPISHIRARLGVTQAAMAKALGVTQGNVSNYERGQTVPPDVAQLLINYAESLGVRITFNDVYCVPNLAPAPAPSGTSNPVQGPDATAPEDLPPSRKNLLECRIDQPQLYTSADQAAGQAVALIGAKP